MQKEEVISEKSKVYEACLKFKIKPSVAEILKLRLKTCLEN